MYISPEVANDLAQLDFKPGDQELIYHEDEDGRFWLHNQETFHQMRLEWTVDGQAYIKMCLLDENGQDVTEDPAKTVERRYEYPHKLRPVAEVLARSAVLFEEAPDWLWHAQSVPLPATMNAFARKYLQPLGSHDLPLAIRDGSGTDSLFTPTEMVHAIAEGVIPVSSTARHMWHDMKSHSLGYVSVSQSAMDALRSVCTYLCDIECEDAFEVEQLNSAIITMLDYYTFEKFFHLHEVNNGRSALLSDILSHPAVQVSPFKKGVFTAVRRSGLEVTRKGTIVRDDHTNRTYQLLRTFFVKNGLPMFDEPAE